MEKLKPSKPLRALYKRTVNELGDEAKDDVHLLYAKINPVIRRCHVNRLLDLAECMAFLFNGILPDNERVAVLVFYMRYGNGKILNDSDEKREAYMKDRVIVSDLEKYGLDASRFWYATLFLVDYIEGFDGGRYYDSAYSTFRSLVELFGNEDYEIRSIEFRKVKKSSISSASGNKTHKVLTEKINSDTQVGRDTIAHIGKALLGYCQASYLQFCYHRKDKNAFMYGQYTGSEYQLSWTDQCALFVVYMQKFLRCMSDDYGGRAPAGEWRFMSHLLAVLYPEHDANRELTATGSDYLTKMVNLKIKDTVRCTETWVENLHYPQDGLKVTDLEKLLVRSLLFQSR